jgi:S1-C subfamily serine protease
MNRQNHNQGPARLSTLVSCLASLALLSAAVAFASPSTRASGFSPDQVTQLKRAVVIITTCDAQGKALLQGSGFFIEDDLVVTSLHVIKGANQISLETFAGTTTKVQAVLATNEEADLALLRIAQPCPNSEFLHIAATPPPEGEAIMLISSPQGSPWKITRGNVGMLWEFSGFRTRLQITAAIAPGSSGGPVVNEHGEVIGIAALFIHSVDDLNFAVPVASLRDLQAQANHKVAKLKVMAN